MSKLTEKLNVFEALKKYSIQNLLHVGSMVSDAKIIILSPDNDSSDTDEDDSGDSNGISDN